MADAIPVHSTPKKQVRMGPAEAPVSNDVPAVGPVVEGPVPKDFDLSPYAHAKRVVFREDGGHSVYF